MSTLTEFDYSGARVTVVGASRGGIGAVIARNFQTAGAEVEITGAEPACLPVDGGYSVV